LVWGDPSGGLALGGKAAWGARREGVIYINFTKFHKKSLKNLMETEIVLEILTIASLIFLAKSYISNSYISKLL
jgi:hypothetical protein